MATSDLGPFTADERLIYRLIVGTWAAYLTGVLYVIAPALGWFLAARIVWRQMNAPPSASRPLATAMMLTWAVAMIVMAFVLVIGHLEFELGLAGIAKSSIGLVKGWALFGVFAVVGMHVDVRPAVIFRASNVLAAQTLALAPLFYVAPSLGLPAVLYTSPIDLVIGRSHSDFVSVALYFREGIDGAVRWKFFSPWAPAAALVACLSMAMAVYDRSVVWRAVGIAAGVVVCLMAQSRLAYLTMPVLLTTMLLAPRLRDPRLLFATAIAGMLMIMNAEAIIAYLEDARQSFDSARAQSSRVRAVLQSIALQRWWDEAPLFGHGAVEAGSHLTEWMAIGTHHSWNGLLFTRGIVGLLCLAIPMGVMAVVIAVKAADNRSARAALLSMIALFLYSFGDNLDVLFYLFWPTFVLFGIVISPARPAPASTSARAVQPSQAPSTGAVPAT